ncbi:MAG: hypothetical protein BWY53_00647 [Parcubacteria group bacterium ADurb.Bin326]|nr:MAG: hypothetical protein BWY53_00647 [Parcubacteria group bacterium ADurb.Bin326]
MSVSNHDLWQLDSKLQKKTAKKPKKKVPGFSAQKKTLEQTGWLTKTKMAKTKKK